MAGPARCRFVMPEGMPAADIRWSGSCRAGLAHGRGLLRAFEAGRPVADGDRDTLIKAFDEAAAAARQLSAAYRRAGNVASARFYRDKAQQLAQQLD